MRPEKREILSIIPYSWVWKREEIKLLLDKLEEDTRREAIEEAVLHLLERPFDELQKIVEEEIRKRWNEHSRDAIRRTIMARYKKLKGLIEQYEEKIESCTFPTDDDERIHEMYKSLPEELQKRMPFVTDIPDFEELGRLPIDVAGTEFYGAIEQVKKKMAELGGLVSIDTLEREWGIPAQRIDEALRRAGFERRSKVLRSGIELIAYKLPIDEVFLRQKMKKFEEVRRMRKQEQERVRREMLELRRAMRRY